jgi:hypothetical protein
MAGSDNLLSEGKGSSTAQAVEDPLLQIQDY